MKKFLPFIFLLSYLGYAQTPTPNIGLQIPATGSNNWYVPLNYNFTKLDLFLGGVSPIPALRVTGNVNIGGTVTANAFVGVGGTGFAFTPGGAQGAAAYFSSTGTSSNISGVAITGLAYYTPASVPRVATANDLSAVLQTASGCTASGALYSPNSNICSPTTTPACISGLCYNASGIIIGPPFGMTMTSCSACGNFEIGFTSASPATFVFSYTNGTPASGTLSDGTHSGTFSGGYTNGSIAFGESGTVTFTTSVTATNSQTANATGQRNSLPCTFYGLSTGPSPTGATASGTSNNACVGETSTLASGLGTLANYGLGSTQIGQTFTFSSPGGRYVTILATETSSGCNRNPWAFGTSTAGAPVTAITQAISGYVNEIGGNQGNMCLYTFGPYSASVSLTDAN